MEQKIDVVFPGHSCWIHLLTEDFYRVHLDKLARALKAITIVGQLDGLDFLFIKLFLLLSIRWCWWAGSSLWVCAWVEFLSLMQVLASDNQVWSTELLAYISFF